MASRRPQKWQLPAVAPEDYGEPTWDVWIEQAHVDGLTRCGMEPKFARLKLIPEALSEPIVVFQGWERDEKHDNLCYVCCPTKDFRSTTIETPPPKDMVFLVFVTAGGKVSDWRWERTDEHEPNYPIGFRERFRRMVWPTIKTL